MKTSTDIIQQDIAILDNLIGKKFLITGGNGMLGRAFTSQIMRYVPTAELRCLNRRELDVRDPEAFSKLTDFFPDYIIHCAALVDADYCEDHPDEGRASIVGGTRNVVEFARCCNATVLYPQSFLIYDGAEPFIDENTVPHPLGVYGKLKLEAEKLVLEDAQGALSVRMGGFFGGGATDNNFVGRITPHLANLIRQGISSIDIGNRVWQPSYTNDLAANCLLLLAANRTGIYCMASHDSASFHELTVEIASLLGISDKIEICCIDAALLAAKERAPRPKAAIMRNRRLQCEGLDRQRPWRQNLAEYLNQPFFKELFQ